MKMLAKGLLVGSVVFLATNPISLSAGTHYVSGSGSNAPPYDTWVTASHTIQAAIDASGSGDTVLVAAGTYSPDSGEQFPIQFDEFVDGIQIAGASGVSKVIIDAQRTGTVFQLDQCNATVKSLTLTGGSGDGISASHKSVSVVGCWILNNQGTGVTSWFGSAINLSNSVVSGNGRGVYCVDQGSLAIENCVFSGNSGCGIYTRGATIEGSEITGNGGQGIYAGWDQLTVTSTRICDNGGDGVDYSEGSLLMSRCIVAGNSGSGIGIMDAVGTVAIVGCTVCDNDGNGIMCNSILNLTGCIVAGNGNWGAGALENRVAYCDFWNNQLGDLHSAFFPSGLGEVDSLNANGDSCDAFSNIYLAPVFLDSTARDYHLLFASPCIDAGDPLSAYDPDFTVADIGALYFDQIFTNVSDRGLGAPNAVAGHVSVSPNPFNPQAEIRYRVDSAGPVRLRVYDIAGRVLQTLVERYQPSGEYRVVWNGKLESSEEAPSGVYVVRLDAGDFVATRKMVLLK